ncbi:protein rep [Nocardiopsis sp. YSL2]|uniref:protein rep n=1 Tax=Nocardiopsis sp. YSL2 TaxID=2939492 RepID=UPI0026F4160E|nr:protein rep [Nocardiopsis sp. YSL2]
MSVVEGAATLVKGAGKDGQSHFTGVSTCAKVHLCPVCSGRIRSGRADEMQAYVQAWEDAGHGVVLVTFTLRHFERQGLKDLVKLQTRAWSKAFGAKAGKMWVRLKDQFGIRGYARSWEVTRGPNGWHPHWHVLLFVDTPWTETQAAEFSAAAYARWSTAVVKEGGYLPSEKRGVRVDLPKAVDAPLGELSDGAKMARYLVKTDEGMKWRVGSEMTRGDVKSAKKAGRRTPFEILADTGDPERPEPDRRQDVALWREFEEGSHGIRALIYSSKIKELLDALVDVEDQTDAELAEPETGDAIAVFPAATWYPHVVAHKGRRLDLVKAAERNGQPAVRRLIERWGLEWGTDVLPPTEVENVAETRILPDRADRTGWAARRSDARLDVPEPRDGEKAAAPVQEALTLSEDTRPDTDTLAEIRAAMAAKNRATASAGVARLRAQGRLAPIQD